MTEVEDQPRCAFFDHVAFAIVLSIVIARCLMLESIRSTGTDLNAPATPGAATSIVLDWLSALPAILILARRLVDRSRPLSFHAAHAFLFALAAWSVASLFWADDRFLTLISAARIAGGAAIFWASSKLVSRPAHLRVVVGVIVGLLLVNVIAGAIYQNSELADLKQYWLANKPQILADHGWREGDYAASRFEMKLLAGEMINFSQSANVLGALIVTATLAAIGAAMQRVEDRDDHGVTGVLFLAAASGVYVLAHTGSKASWAALGLGITLLIGWRFMRNMLMRQCRAAFAIALASIAIGIAAVITLGIARHGLPTDSLNFRWRYWLGARALVLERPITGVGWGDFADAYLRHRMPAAAEEIQDPHNFLVRWLTELGAVGLLLGVGWLVAWGWLTTRAGNESTIVRSQDRPMRISRVLLICPLALLGTLACAVDFSSDANFVILEVFRRSMYLAVIALAVATVCLGRRAATDDPYYVDERPASWLLVGLFVGVAMLLLQSTIDIALFQPGIWPMMMLAMGALLGQRVRVAATLASPAQTSSEAFSKSDPRATQASPRRHRLVFAIAIAVWLGGGFFVGNICFAERFALMGDRAMVQRHYDLALIMYGKANGTCLVSNFDYASKEAAAYIGMGRPYDGPAGIYSIRTPLDAAIAAAPHHALSWLTRSRYLSSQPNVAPADRVQSIADFAHAIALNPNDVDLRIEYAELLERFGQRGEAAEQLRAALQLDDQLDPAEPKRLDVRSPGRRVFVQQREASLAGESQ